MSDYDSKIIRKRIRVYGSVQGGGFRYRTEHAAESVGATGWVRNDPDGSVFMEIQGTEEQIDRVFAMVSQGTYVNIQINGGIIYVFMMGITDGRKDFDFNQVITCDECGRYGRYQVYMTYMVLSLFFIPCFKWNRHYYVQTTCCNALYELDPEIGRRIARGEDVEILPQHLQRVNAVWLWL